ncbi:MAG TPA: sugar phosphate isomerase/epimerase family protein [Pirellulales bacterium]|jgi:sugar phosphate isomerase/epimerase|nr:sugar phosphate isomerase/epimerase family protein [Pirellulales bacterium]
MTPMLFSVSYAGFWGQCRLDLEAFFAKAAALGYPAVEIMGKRPHLSVLDADRQTIAAVRDAAARAGVEIGTIAAYTNFTMGRDTEIPSVEIQVAYVRQLAQLAEQLGAKIVRIFTGYLVQQDNFQRDWDLCVHAVRQCAAVTADCGVILGVQNHHDVGIGVDSYVEFLDEVDHPNCRAMFDPWAPALHGDDLYRCALRLAPRMVQTTLADYVRLPRYRYVPGLVNYERLTDGVRAVPVGEGFQNLDDFFVGLREGGFDGYVAYEMCSPVRGGGSEENLDRTAKASLEAIWRLTGHSADGRSPARSAAYQPAK